MLSLSLYVFYTSGQTRNSIWICFITMSCDTTGWNRYTQPCHNIISANESDYSDHRNHNRNNMPMLQHYQQRVPCTDYLVHWFEWSVMIYHGHIWYDVWKNGYSTYPIFGGDNNSNSMLLSSGAIVLWSYHHLKLRTVIA